MTKRLHFNALYDGKKWLVQPAVELDSSGRVIQIIEKAEKTKVSESINGFAIPAFCNGHSHAFQLAMAGMAEGVSSDHADDDFWAWRNKMYELAASLNVEQIKVVATAAYSMMRRAGYSSVVEFNYLHHDSAGNPYRDMKTISHALVAAAQDVGIDIVLVPILYQTSDIHQPPSAQQTRFVWQKTSDYLRLIEDLKSEYGQTPGVAIGVGAHSLRAVPFAAMTEVVMFAKQAKSQFHLHIAEQQKEVASALRHYNARPIQWFLETFDCDESVYLVHATHAEDSEVELLAKKKVNVVLCPSTEGDLGDGMFPLKHYTNANGAWLIGSDSHVVIDPWYELRQLDFVERMRLQKRNVLCQPGDQSGEKIFACLEKGEAKIRADLGLGLKIGQRFDALVYDDQHPSVCGVPVNSRLSSLIYSGGRDGLIGWCRGKIFAALDKQNELHRRRIEALGQVRGKIWK